MKVVIQDVWADVVVWGFLSALLSLLLLPLGLLPCVALFLTAWALAAAACVLLAALEVSPAGKAVLITGCDSGFGFALAQHLHAIGFRVLAGCLYVDGEGAGRLRAAASARLHTLQLDVTSSSQLQHAVREVETLIPEGEVLWGLVNNAGLADFGQVEWVPEDTYRKTLEVNLMGTVATTRAFLPLIRRAKGRVVNISSMCGRTGHPLRSSYVLSKYAVEGFTDCLRYEMRRWGVSVSLIEPGNYVTATKIFTDKSVRQQGEAMWAAMSHQVRDDYTRSYFDAQVFNMMNFIKSGIREMKGVIEAMTAALIQVYPRARYMPMKVSTRIRILVATHLPECVYEHLYITSGH